MVVDDVYVIHLQSLQAACENFVEVGFCFGGGITARSLPAAPTWVHDLGGDGHFVSDAHLLDHASDHLLVSAILIDSCGIEVAHSHLVAAP